MEFHLKLITSCVAINLFVTGCHAFSTPGVIQVYDTLTQEPVQGAQASLYIRYSPKNPWGSPQYETQTLKEEPLACFKFMYPTASLRDASISIGKKGYYSASVSLSNRKGIEGAERPIRPELSPVQNAISLIAIDWTFKSPKFYYFAPRNVRHYDCLKADWLPPYGAGIKADIEFSLQKYNKSGKDFAWFKIRFTNPNDGFELITKPYASGMFIREAPATKTLLNQLDIITPLHNGYPSEEITEKKYAFRVRTQTTPSGEIISAYYGKLYQAFHIDTIKDYWTCGFEYYLNPSPNDRNLEYNGASLNMPTNKAQRIRHIR